MSWEVKKVSLPTFKVNDLMLKRTYTLCLIAGLCYLTMRLLQCTYSVGYKPLLIDKEGKVDYT